MLQHQRFPQPRQIVARPLAHEQLIGIGAAIVTHSGSLAAPDKLHAAPAKMLPATNSEFSWPAIRRPVPTFHWMNGKTISDLESVHFKRLRERRSLARNQFLIARDRDLMLAQIALKCFHISHTAKMQKLMSITIHPETPA